MKNPNRRALWVVGLALALTAVDVSAVGRRRFALESASDFEGGDLKGVAVDSTGRVRAGFNLASTPIPDATVVFSALALKDGSVLLGTGNDGKLIQVRDGQAKVVGESKAMAVTSLAEAWGGTVVAGTLPEGKLMKWSGGKLAELVALKGAEHIWQVAYDPKTQSVFAATGPEGKLWRIGQDGQAQVYFDAEEEHLMSVAVAPDGTVYSGASNKAKLYKISGPGRASVLHDFGRTEVRAIAIGRKGEVYAIANEIQSGAEPPKRPARGQGATAAGPAPAPPKAKGKGTLYRFLPDGTPDQLLDDSGEHFVSLALGDDGKPYVGTGAEGEVYTVEDNHNSVLVANVEERQVGALILAGKQWYVVGSDPAVLHPVRGIGGADAVWTSKVLDAGLRARFGRMTWQATAPLEFSTRTGGTSEPDETWSDWSAPSTAPDVIKSPPGRYLQVRARFSRDKNAVLSEVEIPFITDNLRAVITKLDAASKPASKASKIEASGGPVSAKPSTDVNLEWKVDNADEDELRYRLQYRIVGTDNWFDILKNDEVLTKTSYTWNTTDLPEGRYRVRVSASDELANPPDRVKTHELTSGIVLVDNTPPTIENLRAVGRRIQGIAVDGVGPIQRIEVSLAGSGRFVPFYPKDGILDEQREEFDVDVAGITGAGPALLSVKVYDDANNFVVRNVLLK
jgi:hypothetical protein